MLLTEDQRVEEEEGENIEGEAGHDGCKDVLRDGWMDG